MNSRISSPLLEVWLPADPSAVPSVRRRAIAACAKVGLTDEDCFTLDLALGEALANAVTHGVPASESAADNQVYLGLWLFQRRLIIQVRDSGSGFEPPLPPYRMTEVEQDATHGRGLPLMEILTDALAICRGCAHEGGSSVFLIKCVPHYSN